MPLTFGGRPVPYSPNTPSGGQSFPSGPNPSAGGYRGPLGPLGIGGLVGTPNGVQRQYPQAPQRPVGPPPSSQRNPTGPSVGDLVNRLPGGGSPKKGWHADGKYYLGDSNPRGSTAQVLPRGKLSDYQKPNYAGNGLSASGGFQGSSGGILGSSVGPPAFYGAGLAPASGLGGGLWPSLVSLYR